MLLLIAASCSSLDQSLSKTPKKHLLASSHRRWDRIAILHRRPTIEGNIISEIGDPELRQGESFVDASGLVLAPGFIDTHSHHDRGLENNRDALPLLVRELQQRFLVRMAVTIIR
ncbi:MAG: hypothetical protein CM1200mP40_28220 [Gammaproteobacteria bacterium]|nr:MAG: hypothetical protein CM1200mP40_28220 [Gammaproteobacteria bacterium]